MPRPLTLVAGLAAAGAALAAAPHAGAVTPEPWRSPAALSPPGAAAETVDVAVNRHGSAVAVWTVPAGDGWVVQAATRVAGGPWTAPVALSPVLGSRALRPRAAIGPDGNAAAVWERPLAGGATAAAAAVRPAALGRWTGAEALGGGGARAADPRVAVLPGGDVVAAWTTRPAAAPGGAAGRIAVAERPAATGRWSSPATRSSLGATLLGLEAGPDGRVLAWWRLGTPPDVAFQSALRAPDGSWGPADTLPEPGPRVLDVALGPDGAQVAVAPEPDAASDPRAVIAATRPAGGAWGSFRRIAPPDPETAAVSRARVVVDGRGTATALWQRAVARGSGSGNVPTAVASTRRAGAAWSEPTTLSAPGRAAYPAGLAAGPGGRAVALWSRTEGPRRAFRAAVRPDADAGWGGVEAVVPFGAATPSPTPSEGLAVDGDGGAVAWFRRDGRVRASDRIAGAPGDVGLSASQLLVNQRIAQAAVRRANALDGLVDGGLDGGRIRPGALTPPDFGPTVRTEGADDGRIIPPGARRPVAVPGPEGRSGGEVRLTAAQLLVNQRIGQAAVRRANALRERLSSGLTGGDLRPGTIGAEALAPGVSIASADPGGDRPAPSDAGDGDGPPDEGGRASLTGAQLVINQRIYQAALVRLNALRHRLETGVDGASVRDGSIAAANLADELR